MNTVYKIQARTAAGLCIVTVTNDGFGYTVQINDMPHADRNLAQAIKRTRDALGRMLHDADRNNGPWGMILTIPDVGTAVWGDWKLPDFGGGGGAPSLFSQIRSHYRSGTAGQALENALLIVTRCTTQRAA